MASALPTSAKCLMGRKSAMRLLICVIGILLIIALPNLNSTIQMPSASAVKPAKIDRLNNVQPASLIGPINVTDSNQQSSFVGQSQSSLQSATGSANLNNDITIIPKIDVYISAPHLWADGQTPAIITISLKAENGNQAWNYRPDEELVFELEPRNALFDPPRVKIAAGETTSEPTTVTAKQPIKLELKCTPERKYKGLAINKSQPEHIEFITPIDAIGIEPISGTCPVNVAMPFEIFLYNKKDSQKTRLSPRNPISIQVVSENGNGSITNQPGPLTAQELSRFVEYVGTKTGGDTIKAIASYEGAQILGHSNRKIVFPLWMFLSGLAGSLLGSSVRYFKTSAAERNVMLFLESLFYGGVVCIILIIYPIGTKLPQIINFLQPLLIFVLGALVSVFGPQSLYWALSFIPRPGAQANG